jgi:hypothetical protein
MDTGKRLEPEEPRPRMHEITGQPVLPVYAWLHGMGKENYICTFYVYLLTRTGIVAQQIDHCSRRFIYYILKLLNWKRQMISVIRHRV